MRYLGELQMGETGKPLSQELWRMKLRPWLSLLLLIASCVIFSEIKISLAKFDAVNVAIYLKE